jgi:hypothetical protein
MGKGNKKLLAALRVQFENDPERLFQQTPKPPKDDKGNCSCGCCCRPDRGACPRFLEGANGRCAVCDHSKACHRRKGEPPPADWNNPISLPAPAPSFLSPSAFVCPDCGCKLAQCPKCAVFIPLKDYDSGYHIAHCAEDGYFDQACSKAKETCAE